MKAMKGLLLGTAAGLFAVASAQAADLPVKAKPVEYVKVCSLYGAGFFYVPGTDTCLKIGAYVRSEHAYGAGNIAAPPGGYLSTPASAFTRDATAFYSYRARILLTTDWRTQTDYGVLRAYAAIQAQNSSGDAANSGVAGITRAFIQFAGFTIGHGSSYYDFFEGFNYGYVPSLYTAAAGGPNGTDIVAYTWQLGNGWSASVNLEDSSPGTGAGRTKRVVNASVPGNFVFTSAGSVGLGWQQWTQAAWSPDFVGNIRIDQAWGSAQLMGALHNMNASYYSGLAGTTQAAGTGPNTIFGHPGQTWGWAVGGGFRLLNVFQPKNRFEVAGSYCSGAIGYCVGTPQAFIFGSGNEVGAGYAVDGVYINGSGIERSTSWTVAAAYEHFWSAQWRTAVQGGYVDVSYGDTARNYICGLAPGSTLQYSGVSFVGGAAACQPNFSQYWISTRTAWNPHPMLEIGLDLIWYHINSANSGIVNIGTTGTIAGSSRPAGPYQIADQDRALAVLRVQKTILP